MPDRRREHIEWANRYPDDNLRRKPETEPAAHRKHAEMRADGHLARTGNEAPVVWRRVVTLTSSWASVSEFDVPEQGDLFTEAGVANA